MIVQNNQRKECAIRIEVVRDRKFTEAEDKLATFLGEIMSALFSDGDDTLINMAGMMLSAVTEKLNVAMNMRETLGAAKLRDGKVIHSDRDRDKKDEDR
jgi:hypothetical protein